MSTKVQVCGEKVAVPPEAQIEWGPAEVNCEWRPLAAPRHPARCGGTRGRQRARSGRATGGWDLAVALGSRLSHLTICSHLHAAR